MANVFIIGYMACGKTTFGRALARATGREFIDLDFYIEQRFRSSISKIFAERGEVEFRRMESAMLREAGEFENVIIACGGGTPCFNGNMDWMLANGETVFLETSPEKIVERLIVNSTKRPLMSGKSSDEIATAVTGGLADRLPHYRRARIIFPGEYLEDRRQIAEAVNSFVASHSEILY